jgi:hypothetical protein
MPQAPRRPVPLTHTDFGDLNVYDIQRYIDHLLHEQWQREQTVEGKERARRAREFMQRSGIRAPGFGEEEDPAYSWHSGPGGGQYKGTGPERTSREPLPRAQQPKAPKAAQREYEQKERERQRNAPPPPDVDGWSPQDLNDYSRKTPATYHDLSAHEQAVLGALIARKLFGGYADVTPESDKVFQLDPNAKATPARRDDRMHEAQRAQQRAEWAAGNARPLDVDPNVDDFGEPAPEKFSRRGQTE